MLQLKLLDSVEILVPVLGLSVGFVVVSYHCTLLRTVMARSENFHVTESSL